MYKTGRRIIRLLQSKMIVNDLVRIATAGLVQFISEHLPGLSDDGSEMLSVRLLVDPEIGRVKKASAFNSEG